MSLHRNSGFANAHQVHSYEYANAAARAAATGFVAADIGRIARQTDDNSFYVLTAITPTWVSITGSGGATPKAPITWGSSSVSSTTTTRYLHPWYEDSLAPTTVIQWRVPYNGTINLMRVHATGAGNGNAIVYTLRVNSVASALTVSMLSTAADGSDLANSVAVTAGDLVDIEVTKAASVGASPSDITCSVQYTPT